jgi:hypothetical protein
VSVGVCVCLFVCATKYMKARRQKNSMSSIFSTFHFSDVNKKKPGKKKVSP